MTTAMQHPTPIWVIDDDQSIRWVLERSLTNAGFKVSVFETASTALTQFKRSEVESRPSLILTDFRMPGINGFELLKQIKNIDPILPVIIMTAYSDLDTTVEAYQEGAFEYLAKPFDIDDAISLVKNAIQEQLDRKRGSIDNDNASLLGTDIHEEQLTEVNAATTSNTNWQTALKFWARQALANGKTDIFTNNIAEFEKVLIDCALDATKGRKQEAAKLLGWGRNTLTRKLKEHR